MARSREAVRKIKGISHTLVSCTACSLLTHSWAGAQLQHAELKRSEGKLLFLNLIF